MFCCGLAAQPVAGDGHRRSAQRVERVFVGHSDHATKLCAGRDDAAAEHCGVAAAVWRGDLWHCENAGGLNHWRIIKLAN